MHLAALLLFLGGSANGAFAEDAYYNYDDYYYDGYYDDYYDRYYGYDYDYGDEYVSDGFGRYDAGGPDYWDSDFDYDPYDYRYDIELGGASDGDLDYGWHRDPWSDSWDYGYYHDYGNGNIALNRRADRRARPSGRSSQQESDELSSSWLTGEEGREPLNEPGRGIRGHGPELRVEGKIERLTTVRRFERERVLARVRQADGSARLVDLGPRQRIEPLGLQEGDDVQVRGRRGMLAAGLIRHEGRSLVVQQGFDPRDPRNLEVHGEVAELDRIDSFGQHYVLARIDQDNGRTSLVELGPVHRVERLDIDEGDRVRIEGRRQMIAASRVESRGQVATIRLANR